MIYMNNCKPETGLSDREKMVCGIICKENKVRFNQLKRLSGLHQEILSRILKRNIGNCGIAKDENFYFIKFEGNNCRNKKL